MIPTMARANPAFVCSPVQYRRRATTHVSTPTTSRPSSSTATPHAALLRRSAFLPHLAAHRPRRAPTRPRWSAMLGGGGILGVGPAEMVVVFGVGWLVLGPTKLFALSRDVGRVVGDLRRSAIDASSTFTDAMEGELRDAEEQEALAAAALAKATAKAAGVVAGDEDEEEVEEDEEELAFVSGPDVGGILRDVSDTMVAGPAAAVAAETDAAALGVADRTVGGRLPDLVAPTDAVVTRARFMEQLSRANDPEQQAEADIVGATLEEDVEVARLEYELVKARLAAKRRQEAARAEEASVKGGAEAEE